MMGMTVTGLACRDGLWTMTAMEVAAAVDLVTRKVRLWMPLFTRRQCTLRNFPRGLNRSICGTATSDLAG